MGLKSTLALVRKKIQWKPKMQPYAQCVKGCVETFLL